MVDITSVSDGTFNVIGFIPMIIGKIRDALISLFTTMHLSGTTIYPLFAILISCFLAYKIIKQWVVGSIFLKVSTFLNFLLIALLIFMVLNYVH